MAFQGVLDSFIMMKQVNTNTPEMPEDYSLFFSALPAPVPLYFDGVTLKR
jgi:hypothetical protein